MTAAKFKVDRMLTLRLEQVVYDELERIAAAEGRPVANLARRAIHAYVARHGGNVKTAIVPDPVESAVSQAKKEFEQQLIERLLEGNEPGAADAPGKTSNIDE